MAKKKTTTRTTSRSAATGNGAAATLSKRDVETIRKITDLGHRVGKSRLAMRDTAAEIPTRTASTTRDNSHKRILEMGDNTQTRNLFNFGQARKFMQTILLAKGCKELIERGKTSSLRGMFYAALHTIEGTKEKTFADQSESDAILEDLEVSLG